MMRDTRQYIGNKSQGIHVLYHFTINGPRIKKGGRNSICAGA